MSDLAEDMRRVQAAIDGVDLRPREVVMPLSTLLVFAGVVAGVGKSFGLTPTRRVRRTKEGQHE